MLWQVGSSSRAVTTDGVIYPHESIRLNAEIRLRNQTHRHEKVSEISMEPRRLELLTPFYECNGSLNPNQLHQQDFYTPFPTNVRQLVRQNFY